MSTTLPESKAPVATETAQNLTTEALVDAFYGEPKSSPAVPPVDSKAPTSTPTTETSPTPEKASVTPTVETKPETPKGTETVEKDPVKKQLAEQREANGRLGRELADQKAKLKQLEEEALILKQKADGTFKEPPKPTPEELEIQAQFKGREAASREEAVRLYGKEQMDADVYGPDATFRKIVEEEGGAMHSGTWRAVVNDPQPALAAVKAVRLRAFREAYGDDPAKWEEKIADKLKPTLLDELKTQLEQPIVGKEVPGVDQARGTTTRERTRSDAEIFYGSPPAHA